MDFLLSSASIVFLLIAYALYPRLRYRLPPGPFPWPIVGNLFHIKPVRCRCFFEWAHMYGPIISVWFGSTLNVVISSSKLAKEVLKDNDQQLADRHRNRSSSRFSRDGKDLIWADYGPHYVKVRKVCTAELFTAKRLEALRPIREEEVASMVESILKDCTDPEKSVKSVLVREYLGAVAFNHITRLAFGKRFMNSQGVLDEQGIELKAINANGLKLGASLAMAEHINWLRWMFPVEEEAFAQHGARRDRLTQTIMKEHNDARLMGGDTKPDFMDALLSMEEDYKLSQDTIIGLLWDMITAGMDTTTISVEWALAEVISSPRIQQKAQEELDRVVGQSHVLLESDFPALPYLQAIIKESLRLHPPTPLMLPHRANADVKIDGYDLPKGTIVHVNVWALARDPEVWDRPLEFRPERFLEEDVDMKGRDFRFLPFGSGRRVCPGAQLGINLVTSMLGHLLHRFSWRPVDGMKAEEIDLSEKPGLVAYMDVPLRAVAIPRFERFGSRNS